MLPLRQSASAVHNDFKDTREQVQHCASMQHAPHAQDQAEASKHAPLIDRAKILLGLLFLAMFTLYLAPSFRITLPHRFPFRGTGTSEGFTIPDLYTATLEDLNYGLQHGHFTSRNLVEAYLARIDEVNDKLNVVIETNTYALIDADQMDTARSSGRLRGPLHGIPIFVKDNMATVRLDQTYMNTTAGSYALLGSFPSREATVVAKLKAAGAIILGKTNLSQWCGFRGSTLSAGWSARGGQCTGAYFPDQNPLGSSSGSAVATSIGLVLGALGSETHGSVIYPAHMNNSCGIKPTVGLTSRSMVGVMARDCKTAATLLTVIAGKDVTFDAATDAIPFDEVPDYASYCTKEGLQGARIGIPNDFIASQAVDPVYLSAFSRTVDILRTNGGRVQEHVELAALDELVKDDSAAEVGWPVSIWLTVWDYEYSHALQQYLNQLYINPHNITSLEALVNYTMKDPGEEYPAKDIGEWNRALLHVNQTLQDSSEYKTAHAKTAYLGGIGTVTGALDRHELDALIVPSSTGPSIASMGGLPIITVPLGFYPPDTPIVRDTTARLVLTGPNIPL